ncbi:hypothetical protein ACSBR2_040529 [Camellia fascicularis]
MIHHIMRLLLRFSSYSHMLLKYRSRSLPRTSLVPFEGTEPRPHEIGALVERWWDTTNSFHFSTVGEMTLTPYDFAMLTGLEVGSDPISFDIDVGEGSKPKTLEQMEQYARGFLTFVLGTTLFSNRWNTVGLYLLSALVTLPRVCFYD